MAMQTPMLVDTHLRSIEEQHSFFVGSTAQDKPVNIPPKGTNSSRVPGPMPNCDG